MKFSVNQKDLQESLSFCQNVIERRSTLPILSNVLLEASGKDLIITATDLDMIFVHRIQSVEIEKEGKTCLLYTSPSPRDPVSSRMPSSA